MKRIYLLLIITAMCAVNMSAQMRLWSDGGLYLEMPLSDIDSITFVKPHMLGQTHDSTLDLNYDNWRENEYTRIYCASNGSYSWQKISLPWRRAASVTTIPDEYRFPNEQYRKDSTPTWEMAFNLCPDSTLLGVHMFGLWDSRNQIMRVFSYMENAEKNAYCFYSVTSTDTTFIDWDAKTWQPTDSIIKAGKWNQAAISNSAARPSCKTALLMPITGTLSGQVSQGWLCFDIKFADGNFESRLNKTIIFQLYAVTDISFTGSASITGWLYSNYGKITTPGNKNKAIAGYIMAGGELFSDVSSIVADAVSVGSTNGGGSSGGAAVVAAFGGIGAVATCVGNVMNAIEEGKDTEYKLDIDFKVSETADFQGTLTSVNPGQNPSVSMSYHTFFEQILNHPKPTQGAKNRNGDTDSFSLGIWNLKKQPVIYMCSDASYFSAENSSYDEIFEDKDHHPYILASFLDPTSLELLLSSDDILFDRSNVKKVSLVAYDFIFTDDNYNLPAQPYYDFYGISNDPIDYVDARHFTFPCGELGNKMFLLDTTADYQMIEKTAADHYTYHHYTGTTTGFNAQSGLSVYNQMFSPAIGIGRGMIVDPDLYYLRKSWHDEIGVSVVVEIEFNDGDKHLFTERFLPQIKAYSLMDAAALRDRIENTPTPTNIDGVELEMPLFEKQKAKALRILNPMAEALMDSFAIVKIGDEHYEYGIRIREWQDADTPGLVISTTGDNYGGTLYTSTDQMSGLHDYLIRINGMDAVNSRLEQCSMPTLDNCFLRGGGDCNYNIAEGQCCGFMVYMDYKRIIIYKEDANGNLTPLSWNSDINW